MSAFEVTTTTATATATPKASTDTLRNIVGVVGHALESGAVEVALDVLGLMPGAGFLKLALTQGLPALGKALGTITAPEISEADLAEAIASMQRVAAFDLAKAVGA